MKKFFIISILIFITVVFYGHPAQAIIIKINQMADNTDDTIMIDIKHNLLNSPVQDPKKHYIKTITLKVNGKLIKIDKFTSQNTVEEEKDKFNYKVKKGDKVTVEAVCNLSGFKSNTIIVK